MLSKSPYILITDKKSNATEVQFQVVDKGYVTDKEFKNYRNHIKMLPLMLPITKMIFTLKF